MGGSLSSRLFSGILENTREFLVKYALPRRLFENCEIVIYSNCQSKVQDQIEIKMSRDILFQENAFLERNK